MNQEELYAIWANPKSPWSQWVAPVLFTQVNCEPASSPTLSVPEIPWRGGIGPNNAIILDLPGAESIKAAIALARFGFTPVPLFNASPTPASTFDLSISASAAVPATVDMRPIVEALCSATKIIRALPPSLNSPPVFMLDSNRLRPTVPPDEGVFDNRWIVFPQDFPSADYLRSHGISRVLLVQDRGHEPQNDLAHVLLRWQQQGIGIYALEDKASKMPAEIKVRRPSAFKTAWYRALAMLGLRRSAAGGFGSYIPESSAAG